MSVSAMVPVCLWAGVFVRYIGNISVVSVKKILRKISGRSAGNLADSMLILKYLMDVSEDTPIVLEYCKQVIYG